MLEPPGDIEILNRGIDIITHLGFSCLGSSTQLLLLQISKSKASEVSCLTDSTVVAPRPPWHHVVLRTLISVLAFGASCYLAPRIRPSCLRWTLRPSSRWKACIEHVAISANIVSGARGTSSMVEASQEEFTFFMFIYIRRQCMAGTTV